MGFQPHETFRLLFRLAVADAQQRDDRRDIHHGHGIGILGAQLAGGDQAAEDPGVIGHHPLHIPPGVQRGQLRRAELLDGHHPAEAADSLIVEGVLEYLPHLFKQCVLGDLREYRDILGGILHMDVDPVGIPLVLKGGLLHDGVKDRLLAGKVVVKGRCFNTDGFGDLTYADGIISPGGEQLQRLFYDPFSGVLLLHDASKTN